MALHGYIHLICNVILFLRKLVQVHKLGMTQKTSDHSSDSEIVNAVQCTCEDGIIAWDEPNRPDTKYMQEQSGN